MLATAAPAEIRGCAWCFVDFYSNNYMFSLLVNQTQAYMLLAVPVHSFPRVSVGRVKVPYLAVVLSLVLQHLLQVQAAGQVAFSQVVAELRNTEQTLLHTHGFTVRKQE